MTALVLNSIAGNVPSQSINLKQLEPMKSVAFDNLIETLNKNSLPLRKWGSNESQLVTRFPKDLQEAGKAYEINNKIIKSKHWD